MTHSRDVPLPDPLSSFTRRLEERRRGELLVPEAQIGSPPTPATNTTNGTSLGPDYILQPDGTWAPRNGEEVTLETAMAVRRRLLNQMHNAVQSGVGPRRRVPRGWTLEQMAEYLEANGIPLPDAPGPPPVAEPPAPPAPPPKRDVGRGFDL